MPDFAAFHRSPEDHAPGERPLAFATRQLHAGDDRSGPHRPRATPIHLTAAFGFDDLDDGSARFADSHAGYSYTRVSNPTNAAVERRLADLEGGAGALLVGSGQAATATAVLSLLGAGDHLVAAARIYEGTKEFLRTDLARLGIALTLVDDLRDPEEWRRAIRPETRAFFAESVANPTNDVLDIRAVADIAHAAGVPLIVDNTLPTPYLLRPIEHGADLVVHSASKFLAGHGTVLGGVLVDAGRFDWAAEPSRYPHLAVERGPAGTTLVERAGSLAALEYARRVAMRYGPSPSPINAFLILQGVETLSLRVERQSASAARLASWLEAQPGVASVDHLALASHPDHALAVRLLAGGSGSVFSVTLHGGLEAARAFLETLRIITHTTHLGDVRSLAVHPASTTHLLRTAEELDALGIGPGLVRLSIGLEDPDDLIDDLARGLAAASAAIVRESVTA